MTMWWGRPWPSESLRADVCADDGLRVSVPVGYACTLCDVLIEETDRGISMMGLGEDGKAYPVQEHIECQMRNVMGCSASLRGDDHDHSGSYRDDALRVWAWIQTHPLG
jgi:hypothetical protein